MENLKVLIYTYHILPDWHGFGVMFFTRILYVLICLLSYVFSWIDFDRYSIVIFVLEILDNCLKIQMPNDFWREKVYVIGYEIKKRENLSIDNITIKIMLL